MRVPAQDVTSVRPELDALQASDDEYGDAVLRTGLSYLPDHEVRIFVRKRDGRYDLTDGGHAVNLAGRPAGWLETASDTVDAMGMNINRRGIVFVTGFERRDLTELAMRLAECSRLVHMSLLESAD